MHPKNSSQMPYLLQKLLVCPFPRLDPASENSLWQAPPLGNRRWDFSSEFHLATESFSGSVSFYKELTCDTTDKVAQPLFNFEYLFAVNS